MVVGLEEDLRVIGFLTNLVIVALGIFALESFVPWVLHQTPVMSQFELLAVLVPLGVVLVVLQVKESSIRAELSLYD